MHTNTPLRTTENDYTHSATKSCVGSLLPDDKSTKRDRDRQSKIIFLLFYMAMRNLFFPLATKFVSKKTINQRENHRFASELYIRTNWVLFNGKTKRFSAGRASVSMNCRLSGVYHLHLLSGVTNSTMSNPHNHCCRRSCIVTGEKTFRLTDGFRECFTPM